MNLLLLFFISIVNAFLIDRILELLLILHLKHLLMGDVVLLLGTISGPPDDLLAKWLGGLRSQLLEVLVETIGKEYLLPALVVSHCVLFSKLLDDCRVAVSVCTHHLLPELLSFELHLMALLLKLSLLPLLVGDSGHDFLVGCRFFLFVFDFSLFLISEPLLNVLVSLFEKALLEPVFEYFIGGLLLHLLFESLIFGLPVSFNTLLLILLSLSLFPFGHAHLFLLLN